MKSDLKHYEVTASSLMQKIKTDCVNSVFCAACTSCWINLNHSLYKKDKKNSLAWHRISLAVLAFSSIKSLNSGACLEPNYHLQIVETQKQYISCTLNENMAYEFLEDICSLIDVIQVFLA